MNSGTKPFIICRASDNHDCEYLGSDGVPISESYELYLQKCAAFKSKAKKYAKDNEQLKNSIIHHIKVGYHGSNEWEILLQRSDEMTAYVKAFNFKVFDEDPNAKFECFTGKGKRIRIIRELNEKEKATDFSEDFDKKRSCWFTRYCILSRFIQAARSVIVRNRLLKILEILKTLTPEKIIHVEKIMARERGESVENILQNETQVKESYPSSCSGAKEKYRGTK